MTNTTENEVKTPVFALAKWLECEQNEITNCERDHYGLAVYELNGREYAVGTDEEADEAAAEAIRGSVWAFNASFILGYCGLPLELEEAIKAFQGDKCERANDALLALIEKWGFEAFAEQAISADGRAYFLNTYNGNEDSQGDYYIYRLG